MKTLLVLNGSLSLDSNSTFVNNLKTALSFFDIFVQIRADNRISSVSDVTPSSVSEQYVLHVDNAALTAKDVDLIITIRDKKYIIDIK